MKNTLKALVMLAPLCAAGIAHADSSSLDLTVKATIGNPTPPDVEIRYFVGSTAQTGDVTFDLGGDMTSDGTNTYWGTLAGLTTAPATFGDFSTKGQGAVEIYDKGDSGLIQFSQIKLSTSGATTLAGGVSGQALNANIYGLSATGLDLSKVVFDDGTNLPADFYTKLSDDAITDLSQPQTYDLKGATAGQSVFLPLAIAADAVSSDVTTWTKDKFSGQITVTVTPTFTNIF